MSSTSRVDELRRARIARYSAPPPGWAVALRPLGYLVLLVVWLILFGIAWALPFILPAELADRGFHTSTTLAHADLGNAIAYIAVIVVLAAPILGYVFLALPLASGSLAVLAATYVVRSLRPSYRRERLSATGWSYGSIGLSILPPAVSLIPVRMTRWSGFWAGAYLLGWMPSGGTFLAGAALGLGYFATIAWTFWPAAGAVAVIGPVVSALFLTATVVLVVREVRRRYLRPAPGTDD